MSTEATRLQRTERYDVLLDAAAELLADRGIEQVSMETVAARAGVSRPLVYKHFANRGEILSALFRRETSTLDARVEEAIRGATGFEEVIRVSVRAWLDGMAQRGRIFVPLLQTDILDAGIRREQESRQERTHRFYARLAVRELGLDPVAAEAAIAVLISGLAGLVTFWRANRGAMSRGRLEETYVALVVGGLRALPRQDGPASTPLRRARD